MTVQRFFSTTILCAAALGMALLMADRFVVGRRILYERLGLRAQTLAESAAEVALPSLKDREPLDKRALRLLVRLPSVSRLAVYDADDRLLFDAVPEGRQHPDAGVLPVSADVGEDGRRYGRVGLWMSLASTDRALWQLSTTGLLIAPVVLVLIALTALAAGRAVGGRLREFAAALAAGNPETLRALPDLLQKSELGDIARAFRTLEERLLREEAARRETERLRDEMAGMVVHDLKHPLAVVKAILYLLRDPEFDDTPRARREEQLGMAQRALSRLDAMIGDILHVAGLSDPSAPLERRRIGLRAFLVDCAEESRLVVEQSKRSFASTLDPSALARSVLGNEMILRRLIGNLVTNAVEHSEPAARITLAARPSRERPGDIEVSVHNSDSVIAPESMGRIFDPGVSTRATALNAGLGLAFCRLAAERHGARLAAVSTPGSGTKFTLSLPTCEATPPPAAGDEAATGREGRAV